MSSQPLFPPGDASGVPVTLVAVGDIMMQQATQRAAHAAMDLALGDAHARVVSGFRSVFAAVEEDLRRGDLLFGNLETPLAANLIPQSDAQPGSLLHCRAIDVPADCLCDGKAYQATQYPAGLFQKPNFNAHPALAAALHEIGFEVVSTANNHMLDRGHNGIDRTIDALREARLDFVGTIHSGELSDVDPYGYPTNCPWIVKEVQGVRLAFLAYTYWMNTKYGYFDRSNQVYMLPRDNQDRRTVRLKRAIGRARRESRADLVVVSAHWGADSVGRVQRAQRRLARQMVDAGADLILGHHPHVLQPMEKLVAADGREALVVYSLGNFTTDMSGIAARSTAILYVDLVKSDHGARLSRVRFLPVARHEHVDEQTGEKLIQPVAIDRFGVPRYRRHRNRVVRILGRENVLSPA